MLAQAEQPPRATVNGVGIGSCCLLPIPNHVGQGAPVFVVGALTSAQADQFLRYVGQKFRQLTRIKHPSGQKFGRVSLKIGFQRNQMTRLPPSLPANAFDPQGIEKQPDGKEVHQRGRAFPVRFIIRMTHSPIDDASPSRQFHGKAFKIILPIRLRNSHTLQQVDNRIHRLVRQAAQSAPPIGQTGQSHGKISHRATLPSDIEPFVPVGRTPRGQTFVEMRCTEADQHWANLIQQIHPGQF